MEVLTAGKGEWKGNKKTPYDSIAIGSLTEESKVWFYFLSSVLRPSKNLSTMRQEEAILLYALLKGYKISLEKLIEKSIMSYQSNNFWGYMPHPTIITYFCIKEGVNFKNPSTHPHCHYKTSSNQRQREIERS